jgi:hypothetical protein
VVVDLIMICDLGDIYLLQGSMILVDLRSMVYIQFKIPSFESFKCCGLEISRRKIAEVNDLSPCVVTDERSRFTSKFRASGVSNVVS